MSSSIQSRCAQFNEYYDFGNEEFLKVDHEDSITLFERWRARHPEDILKIGDSKRYTILMYAVANGNVHLVSHIIKIADRATLNLLSAEGDTLFEAAPKLAASHQLTDRKQRTTINKVLLCITMLLQAGADIHAQNIHHHTPLEGLLSTALSWDKLRKQPMYREWSKSVEYIKAFIKLYILAGAQCTDAETCAYSKNQFYAQAQEAAAVDFAKLRLLLRANTDSKSHFASVPQELIVQIMNRFWEISL